MRLEAKILVQRTPEEVWAYLGNHANVPQWDRGVGSVRSNPDTPRGVGFEFETLGLADGSAEAERARMSYRVIATDPVNGCTIQLTNSDGNARYFKQAEWRFKVDPVSGGAWITCAAHFKLRLRYLLLAPLLFMMRNAIYRDLQSLKRVLENGE